MQDFLESNAITGQVLETLTDESEFKEWGIHKWGHRKILFKNVKDLINNNLNNDNNKANQFETTPEGFPE